eukprot:CAMPEP_0178734624 /NCGR_PEP_ID=MMETSP0744-20121128/1445_1 /TAXON_ID=913974 /ORGANISM="Nitzschia punctata, Strain CCMP561" /LENGTH=269 /DNA_ID=CAMNT_0020386921 /DNA_START=444 /DNA_END=1253 /DNA_ORIENTATION=-
MASTQPTYQFASTSYVNTGPSKKSSSSRHRRTYSEDTDTDGAGSLTYSATSSVQSGGSAAGESTDSSFADIMRVLDLQDSEQLKEIIKKEGVSSVDELQRKRGANSGASVASSLAYSTDNESHLEGTRLLQTIAGQPSDSYAFDGGGVGDDKMDLLFAPAAPAVVKKTKGNKVVLGKDKNDKSNSNSTPNSKNGRHSHHDTESGTTGHDSSPSPTKSTPTKSPPTSCPGTPPLPRNLNTSLQEEEEDVWYKEWWMSCFPDAFKNLMPSR